VFLPVGSPEVLRFDREWMGPRALVLCSGQPHQSPFWERWAVVVHCPMQAVERALELETVDYCMARTFSQAVGMGIVFRVPLHVRIENENFSLCYPSP
jgi:hypothetical protein